MSEQEVLDLATTTTMSFRSARFFLWILEDWQRKAPLTDEQVAELKQAALDSAGVSGYSPVDVLLSIRAILTPP